MHYRAFSSGKRTEWGYYFELLKLQIFFFRELDIADIFGGKQKMVYPSLRIKKK